MCKAYLLSLFNPQLRSSWVFVFTFGDQGCWVRRHPGQRDEPEGLRGHSESHSRSLQIWPFARTCGDRAWSEASKTIHFDILDVTDQQTKNIHATDSHYHEIQFVHGLSRCQPCYSWCWTVWFSRPTPAPQLGTTCDPQVPWGHCRGDRL